MKTQYVNIFEAAFDLISYLKEEGIDGMVGVGEQDSQFCIFFYPKNKPIDLKKWMGFPIIIK